MKFGSGTNYPGKFVVLFSPCEKVLARNLK